MMATGNTAPINVKNKDKWVGRERQRWSTAFDIPMKETNPPNFPPLTLYIMRALAALTIIDSDQEVLCKALDGFYEELWCHHTEIHKPEHMERILIKAVGEELAKKGLFKSLSTAIIFCSISFYFMSSRLPLTFSHSACDGSQGRQSFTAEEHG